MEKANPLKFAKWFIGIAVVVIAFTSLVGVERINAGSVGIREYLAGGDKGISKVEYVSGWQFYFKPSTKVHEFSIRQQQAEYAAFPIQTKGGTVFTVHPAFNYSLNAGGAAKALQLLGANLHEPKETFIKTALKASLREVTNTYTVDSLLNNVGGYDRAVESELNERLAPYFSVSQFTSGLEPDGGLQQTILDKSKSLQNAIKLQNDQAAIKAQVENDLLEAARDSAVKVKAAQAEAKSIQLVQEALKQSPQFIDKIKAERWDGKLPQYMFGSSTPFINIK